MVEGPREEAPMNGTHACHSFDVRQQKQGSAVVEPPVEAGKSRKFKAQCQGRSVVPLKILRVPLQGGAKRCADDWTRGGAKKPRRARHQAAD
ncbi:hypothetical protein CP532_3812 [Ophiocordyceps camponoti-leonardi (nom. inval.)]|nr:hypothetical protein CP532_3812 [Ophiocordyceps camponoti-leonardi (nom. inval.)]